MTDIKPVAWRCKDYADGWIIDQNERSAREYAEETGCSFEPLYTESSLKEIREENDRLKGEKSLHSADAKTAWAECDELRKAIDSAEIEHGLTSEGNLWRFWSAKAKELAAKNAELEADEQRALDLCAAAVDDYNNALASCEAMAKALERSCIALSDWIHTYASEFCHEDKVAEAKARIMEAGTLAYVAGVQEQNYTALAEYRKEKGE
jgi:hypothetical protein